ncbi:MAG: ATP-binding protein [Bdellovibrionales bacterium]|nr:ATP-binding protein [Bdellovibrionales bacterium]
MFIARKIKVKLLELSGQFRIVTLLGPRQAGKTTLCKKVFPNYAYYSLENPEHRSFAQQDPKTFLTKNSQPLIIDEIQKVPELLSWLQGIVDENPEKKGQYILTGSHQPLLRQSVSQSLAGRTAILTLLPLSFEELSKSAKKEVRPEFWIHKGFLPEIHSEGLNSTDSYRAYTQTYVERDVRQLIQVRDQTTFERFLKLVAGRVGQLLNQNSLASDVGVSPNTINEWLSVLESSFIIFRAIPYHKNFGKRLVKSPKIYFNDIGLATYLLGLTTPEQVSRDPLYGQLFENLVVAEILKKQLNEGHSGQIYFYRDSHGNEIDVLHPRGTKHQPIEIKSSATYNSDLIKGLKKYIKSIGEEATLPTLIYSGDTGPLPQGVNGYNFIDSNKALTNETSHSTT